jgi:hypothetical protein
MPPWRRPSNTGLNTGSSQLGRRNHLLDFFGLWQNLEQPRLDLMLKKTEWLPPHKTHTTYPPLPWALPVSPALTRQQASEVGRTHCPSVETHQRFQDFLCVIFLIYEFFNKISSCRMKVESDTSTSLLLNKGEKEHRGLRVERSQALLIFFAHVRNVFWDKPAPVSPQTLVDLWERLKTQWFWTWALESDCLTSTCGVTLGNFLSISVPWFPQL